MKQCSRHVTNSHTLKTRSQGQDMSQHCTSLHIWAMHSTKTWQRLLHSAVKDTRQYKRQKARLTVFQSMTEDQLECPRAVYCYSRPCYRGTHSWMGTVRGWWQSCPSSPWAAAAAADSMTLSSLRRTSFYRRDITLKLAEPSSSPLHSQSAHLSEDC